MTIKEIASDMEVDEIKKQNGIKVIGFCPGWYTSKVKFLNVLTSLSEKYEHQVDFYVADPDRICKILMDLKIGSVPVLLIYKNESLEFQATGVQTELFISNKIDALI